MIVVIIAASIALAMVGGALIVSGSAAIFLHLPFSFGWHAAWQRPGMLALFALLLVPLFRAINIFSD